MGGISPIHLLIFLILIGGPVIAGVLIWTLVVRKR